MKRYHDVAMVVNGDKTVGYFIQDTGGRPHNPKEIDECFFVTMDEFNRLVQRDEMQHLRWFRESVEASYTDEEVAQMKKFGISQAIIENTEKNYFELNARFDARHAALAYDSHNNFVAGCVGEVISMMRIKMVQVIFTGIQNKLSTFHDEIIGRNPPLQKTTQYTSTYMQIVLPLITCSQVFSETTIHPLFSTDSLKHYRGVNLGRKGLFTKSIVGTPEMEEAISLFDSLTNMYSSRPDSAFSELAEHADEWNVLSEVNDILKAVNGEPESFEQPQRMKI